MSGRVPNPPTLVRRQDFPGDFRWGCATSSYQIEGAAGEGGRVSSVWDTFCAQPGRVADGSSGAVACDHYHRWPHDLDLARDLGFGAYRFSIAWPRIFRGGLGSPVNAAGLDFYDRLVDGMLERGLQPWTTLYHWDLPQSLQDDGGWRNRRTAQAFVEYVDAVTRRLGDRVQYWITNNEPWCSAFLGHAYGAHAPGESDFGGAFQACHHLLLSHGWALPVVRANVRDAQVGIVLSLHPLQPAGPGVDDVAACTRHDGLRNRWFLDPLFGRGYPTDTLAEIGDLAPRVESGDLAAIGADMDFLGVNYYFPETIAADPAAAPVRTRVVPSPGAEVTAFGWQVAPEGMTQLLQRVSVEYRPAAIYLTENGATYDDRVEPDGRVRDGQRRRFLSRHIAALHRALALGAPVKGYFVWSLLDNFEWAEGYARRFGIVHVDFASQVRRVKDSGVWCREFLTAQGMAESE